MKIKLTGELVLIKEQDEPQGTIFIPEAFREKTNFGVVIAVGPGERRKKDNKLRPTEVKPGDKVIFNEKSVYPVTIDGCEYAMMREKHVYAIVDDKT